MSIDINRLLIYPDIDLKNKNPLHDALRSIVSNIEIKKYLELGVWDGSSLLTVIKKTKKQIELITAVDNFSVQYENSNFTDFSHVIKQLNDLNYTGKIELINNNSHIILPEFIKEHRKYDLILVDGDHSYWGQWLDMVQSWQLLDIGGYMIIDDINNNGIPWVKYAVQHFISYNRSKCFVLFQIDHIQGNICILKLKE